MKLTRISSKAGFVAAARLLFASSSALAQTQEPAKPPSEVDQLKQRLQQLEQTVTELKGQIDASETKKKDPAPAIVEAKYSETTTPPPAETTPAEPAKPQDNSKGESTFTIYGFAMLDAGYQLKQNHPDWFYVIRPTKLPSFPNEFAPNGKTYFGVRQSRLGVKSTTPTKYGELKTQFEFELFGIPSLYRLPRRHSPRTQSMHRGVLRRRC